MHRSGVLHHWVGAAMIELLCPLPLSNQSPRQVLKPVGAGSAKAVPGSVATKCLAVLSAGSDGVVVKAKVANNSKAGTLKDVVVVAGGAVFHPHAHAVQRCSPCGCIKLAFAPMSTPHALMPHEVSRHYGAV
jgi:hypothetical protein